MLTAEIPAAIDLARFNELISSNLQDMAHGQAVDVLRSTMNTTLHTICCGYANVSFRNVSHDDDEAQSELESILVSSPSKGQAQDPCPKTPHPCLWTGGSQTIYTTGLMPRFGHGGPTDYAIHIHMAMPPGRLTLSASNTR
ncbi:uncharacterized protein PG986_010877 [Apiospora aurea]|uniref:Uncharacterized protein n=1 Tax=Apiospora aurea TaxID=335848 RepID=A0ABR1Q3Y6_9PEZI